MSADIALNYLFCLCVSLCVLCVYLRYLTKELICHCSIFHKVIQDGIIAISVLLHRRLIAKCVKNRSDGHNMKVSTSRQSKLQNRVRFL